MKYLLLFAFLSALWWVWSKRKISGDDAPVNRSAPADEKMLPCAHCGVYFPESDALVEDGLAYCCEAHRVAGHTAGH
jgi:uncharacterized protein